MSEGTSPSPGQPARISVVNGDLSFAPYPVENHSFTEAASWADEYKRILKLFEDNLRMPHNGKAT